MKNYKVKFLTKEQLIISLDRLTRFKDIETKYLRVYKDILVHNLITPKYSKNELEHFDYRELTQYASDIINDSIKNLNLWVDNDFVINNKLKEYENSIFNISQDENILLNNDINYKACIQLINNNAVKNLQWLKNIGSKDILSIRKEKSLLYPISAIVIAEGATEETLLPKFSQICGFDFSKEGIYVISAGGKSQVVKAYYELCEQIKIPIYVLLDKDGFQNSQEIMHKLRPTDMIHLIKCGEFEDLLPISLIKNTLEYEFNNISELKKDAVDETVPRTKFLEEVFKNRGMHEFKKVEFAHMVEKNIKTIEDVSPEIIQIIGEIANLDKSK